MSDAEKLNDILEEYLEVMRRMTVDEVRELMRQGVPIKSIAAVCPAPAQILVEGERFQFHTDGSRGWVFPVCGGLDLETPDPLTTVSVGEVIDLVAFSPRVPRAWALLRGAATVLGAVEPQYLDPAPVVLRQDPMAWLRAECDGIVLLTSDPVERRRVLRQIRRIARECAP
jgi:hypothetical protein